MQHDTSENSKTAARSALLCLVRRAALLLFAALAYRAWLLLLDSF